MGIPAYFSHIIKEYKSIIKTISNINNIHNLFLDSNSIIYDIINKNDYSEFSSDAEFEKYIIEQVCQQISYYISLIKPQKLVFIAFDGVAPVAKLHQQKTRRFKSVLEQDVKKQIENISNDKFKPKWDTCAITPGTNFMCILSEHIHKFFNKKQKQNQRIIISDSFINGEGEHKIFEYIRNNETELKESKSVIYGLDSDLIMLTLLHLKYNKNMYLFRETPHFIKTIDKSLNPEELYALDIPKFNNIILSKLQSKPLEQTIPDYVFISFILGNDFVSHSPMLNIRTNGIDYIMNTYKQFISGKNSLTLSDNSIHWKCFRTFIEALSKNEEEWFKHEFTIRNKMEKKYKRICKKKMEKYEVIPILNRGEEFYINPNESGWKQRYYKILFNIEYNNERIKEICINYLESLEWTYKYYNGKCPNQHWCYNYYYTPLLSDILIYIPYFNNSFFDKKELVNKPVHPYTQLAYVLPSSSNYLLPKDVLERLKEYNAFNEKSTKCKIQWAFCKYLWESHIISSHMQISYLEEIVTI